jgi:hypothetical protein
MAMLTGWMSKEGRPWRSRDPRALPERGDRGMRPMERGDGWRGRLSLAGGSHGGELQNEGCRWNVLTTQASRLGTEAVAAAPLHGCFVSAP